MSGMSEVDLKEPLTDDQLVEKLRTDIEGLSDSAPMYSRNAYTHRRTPHVVFANGSRKAETEMSCPVDTVERMVANTLIAVVAYRNSVPGPVDLVWRIEPELRTDPETGQRSLYCRLCFEPSLTKVAHGVWVESRLTAQDIWL